MYVILFTLCKIDLTFDSFQEKQFSFQKLPSQAQHNEQKLRKNFDISPWDKQPNYIFFYILAHSTQLNWNEC